MRQQPPMATMAPENPASFSEAPQACGQRLIPMQLFQLLVDMDSQLSLRTSFWLVEAQRQAFARQRMAPPGAQPRPQIHDSSTLMGFERLLLVKRLRSLHQSGAAAGQEPSQLRPLLLIV